MASDKAAGAQLHIGDRIRQMRVHKGLTLSQVAEKTGYTASYLSQVERGITSPSISALKTIADALEVQAAAFMFEEENWSPNLSVIRLGTVEPTERGADHPPVQVVRAHARKTIAFPGSEIRYDLLVPNLQGRVEVVTFSAPPGAQSGEEPFVHAGEEVGIVLRGTLEVTVGNETVTLHAGDTITIDSTVPHRWRNPGDEEVEAIWVMTPPSF